MTTTIVSPSIENLQQFSEYFDLSNLLKSDGVLPWLLANGFDYDERTRLIADIIDESTSAAKIWNSKEFDFQGLPDEEKSKLHQIFEYLYPF